MFDVFAFICLIYLEASLCTWLYFTQSFSHGCNGVPFLVYNSTTWLFTENLTFKLFTSNIVLLNKKNAIILYFRLCLSICLFVFLSVYSFFCWSVCLFSICCCFTMDSLSLSNYKSWQKKITVLTELVYTYENMLKVRM